MHVLFVHQNFPAQFGHIARHLVSQRGWTCTFVSQTPPGDVAGIRKIQYQPLGGARASTHYCSRTFENGIAHAHGVFEACKAHPDLSPDLIVGHSGFGSTLFLPELFSRAPVVNYFEYYYHPHGSDMDFRPEFAPAEIDFLRVRARNAMVLLDLVNCRSGYSPTHFQRELFPAELRHKIAVIFDGIETDVFRRRSDVLRRVGDRSIDPSTRVVTYVSRGFESMRGFDIFMKAAKRIYQQYPDVVFIVVGSDRICYGGDEKHIRHKTFREHVLAQDEYDLSQVRLHRHGAAPYAGRDPQPQRSAHLPDRPVRPLVVAAERPGLWMHRAGVGHRAGTRGHPGWIERAARRFLRHRRDWPTELWPS